jgi:hypothetical protein
LSSVAFARRHAELSWTLFPERLKLV